MGRILFVIRAWLQEEWYFVEFGAPDGVYFSNTWLWEKEFAWSGIVAEPVRCWHTDIKNNRSCIIETNYVWRDSSSILTFNERKCGELSSIDSISRGDDTVSSRKLRRKYEIKAISLLDLPDKHNAPGMRESRLKLKLERRFDPVLQESGFQTDLKGELP